MIWITVGRVSVPHALAWCPQRSEAGVKSPETGVVDSCSCHVGAKNRTWVFCKSSQRSEPLSQLSSLVWVFISQCFSHSVFLSLLKYWFSVSLRIETVTCQVYCLYFFQFSYYVYYMLFPLGVNNCLILFSRVLEIYSWLFNLSEVHFNLWYKG